MKQDLEMKLQAYLDGELSAAEARQLTALVEQDEQARGLLAELRTTREWLRANEPELVLPESREFYWSKIQRAISVEAEQQAPARQPLAAFWVAWRRLLAPVAGVAMVLLLGLNLYRAWTPGDNVQHLAEVENLSDEVGSYSFRSHSENMFVVWLYNSGSSGEPQSYEDDEFVIQ